MGLFDGTRNAHIAKKLNMEQTVVKEIVKDMLVENKS